MLTPEEKAEIRRLRVGGYSLFHIVSKTGHDPKTVRKYLALEKDNQQQNQSSENTQEPLVNITLKAGLIAKMVMDKEIQHDYPVLIPVPIETAVEYFNLQNISSSELKKLGEAIAEAIDKEMRVEQSKIDG